ncbi:hypothetical protein L227DRAFT_133168 [Lentinus tigrinus ALCF2SS1-6]|uniref:DUF7918 domain-containing protein n=1 Tax=Lentinus tigrinus ALCF2SS1-6 TaxID=1328759 RepID=A0A5C2SRR4_9APHY|nr:hypothetical protein L227DRAFT_133168 [Lentinus tigrinus ALCF2SS1-6]
MPKFSGASVSLRSEDKKLTEYEVDGVFKNGGLAVRLPLVRCWVASEAGKVFKIYLHVDRKQRKDGIAMYTWIDGRPTGDRLLLVEPDHAHRIDDGAEVGSNEVVQYRFADISVTDDESVVAPGSANSAVGEIEVTLYAYQNSRRGDRQPITGRVVHWEETKEPRRWY